jgi:TM2 domain-containing membrane protein YozV
MKCPDCGRETQDQTKYCGFCGADMNKPTSKKQKPIEPEVMDEKDVKRNQSQTFNPQTEPKSKLVAGLLGIFVGSLGIHNFYLGYTNRGVIQLLLATVGSLVLVGPIIAGVWGLIEGIQILSGTINTDANGTKLTD